MNIPEPCAASRNDRSRPPAPNPRHKAAVAKTKISARHFILSVPEPPLIHFALGRNFCKGHCSHRGWAFRQSFFPTPPITPSTSSHPSTKTVPPPHLQP